MTAWSSESGLLAKRTGDTGAGFLAFMDWGGGDAEGYPPVAQGANGFATRSCRPFTPFAS